MPQYNFDAPLPGQGLTMEPGALAMERPPQFTDPNEAAEYIFKQLTQPKQVVKLVLLLKEGTPIEYIVRTVLFTGVINGKWTPDLTLLLFNITMWQVEAIAKMKKIDYKTLNDDKEYDDFLSSFTDVLDRPEPKAATIPLLPDSPKMFKGLT